LHNKPKKSDRLEEGHNKSGNIALLNEMYRVLVSTFEVGFNWKKMDATWKVEPI
jgi:hypothetical protein